MMSTATTDWITAVANVLGLGTVGFAALRYVNNERADRKNQAESILVRFSQGDITWGPGGGQSRWQLFLWNSSPLPVMDVVVIYKVSNTSNQFEQKIGILPPARSAIQRDISPQAGVYLLGKEGTSPDNIFTIEMNFTDINRKRWRRDANGLSRG